MIIDYGIKAVCILPKSKRWVNLFNLRRFESSWFLIKKHFFDFKPKRWCEWRDWINQGLWQNQTKLTKGSIKTKYFLKKTVVTNFRFAYINWPSWKFISTLEFLYGSLDWRKVQKFGGALDYTQYVSSYKDYCIFLIPFVLIFV